MIDPLTREPIGDPDALYENFVRHIHTCAACADPESHTAVCPEGDALGKAWYRAERVMAQENAAIDAVNEGESA